MRLTNFSAQLFVALLFISLFFACEDEETTMTTGQGRFVLELTDAPVDDANVRAVFVTVADVKVGGTSLAGFSRTTVEVSSLQNGVTQLIADANLEAAAYSSVEVVLDAANDADNSGAPGCYVLTESNDRIALNLTGDGTLSVADAAFDLEQGRTYTAIIDFDLRKAIVRTEEEQTPYDFAGESRLAGSLRFVNKDDAGTLEGSISNSSGENGTFVVYAYRSGTFSEAEMEGDDDELFLNAVASASVSGMGDYQLSFLESGDYELICAAYEDNNNDDKLEFTGRLRLETLLNLDLDRVSIAANATTTADFTLIGLFP